MKSFFSRFEERKGINPAQTYRGERGGRTETGVVGGRLRYKLG